MPFEKSAGAIIFKKGRPIKYLLLHYPASNKSARDYWDLPKGHIEKGEKEIETVEREVKEETGLRNIKIAEEFKEWIKYFFKHKGKTIFKIVTFYLAESKTEKVKISSEHIGFKWLEFDEAVKQLTFENAKKIIKKADDFLNSKFKMQNENSKIKIQGKNL